jgi:hypothetical protein
MPTEIGKELEWNRMFAYALPNPVKPKSTKCTCGGKNCQTAKHIKCTCRCHSQFHGVANRVGMKPLDKALGLSKTGTETLGDLGLTRELSGLAELEGEI